MAKKNTLRISSLVKDLRQSMKGEALKVPYIPNIIEFCESPKYLALPFPLYPIQKLILRAFYRGTVGNTSKDCINMTPDEIKLCEEDSLDSDKNGNILAKWNSGKIFNELVLVWGRRSGKDFTISVIALYEAMKLLECPGGDPYKMYKIGSASPFTILTIANNKEQTKVLYREMYGKFKEAPYFKDKYLPEGITNDKICLLTPQNVKDNENAKKKGLPLHLGSVQIETGHSNSNGLVGKSCYVLMLDEAGTYKRSSGPGSDEQIYGNLSPSTKSYIRKEQKYNEKGEPVGEPTEYYEGKVISISSPRGTDGVFYRLYNKANETENRLMCRLPTWKVARQHSEQGLREQEPDMTDEKFRMEYGAEFSGSESVNFFNTDCVQLCFKDHSHELKNYGEPGIAYFAHLDPAISNHNYALAVVHKEWFINEKTRKVDYNIILDHMALWRPEKGKPIKIYQVDEYMINLNRIFNLSLVTYDQWNSQSSIEKLQKAGIPAKCTRFNKHYKSQIYAELEHLVNEGRLKLPHHQTLKLEMLNLQRKYLHSGHRIYPKSDGEIRTDDCVDALAGACFNALKVDAERYPMSRLANTGSSPMANSHNWQSMSGMSYGRGTGGQVWNQLSSRSSYPNR